MKVQIQGMLLHHFHGSYWCEILMECEEVLMAVVMHHLQGLLGVGEMTTGTSSFNNKKYLVWSGTSEDLTRFKLMLKECNVQVDCGMKFCNSRCAFQDIDSVAHSLDHGPDFSFVLDVVDSRQESLALA